MPLTYIVQQAGFQCNVDQTKPQTTRVRAGAVRSGDVLRGLELATGEPAKFYKLTAWNNQKGAEWVGAGALQFHDFVMANNEQVGIDLKDLGTADWGEERGSVIKDGYVIGYVDALNETGSTRCQSAGIALPYSPRMTVNGTTFINHDRSCSAMSGGTDGGPNFGGWYYRTEDLHFYDSPNKILFLWAHQAVFLDVDGSLSGTVEARQLEEILVEKIRAGGYDRKDYDRDSMLAAIEEIPADYRGKHNARLINRLLVRANTRDEGKPTNLLVTLEHVPQFLRKYNYINDLSRESVEQLLCEHYADEVEELEEVESKHSVLAGVLKTHYNDLTTTEILRKVLKVHGDTMPNLAKLAAAAVIPVSTAGIKNFTSLTEK
uniref:Uncharacterized protein n=1 Tax=Branchiostoma floridae TaxID=7739 RepID=C3XT17_BRAFL|eukprot:XP_002612741.1 hypothetical protein BRAFLDRAFT_97279 [Branchiostoma floridae]